MRALFVTILALAAFAAAPAWGQALTDDRIAGFIAALAELEPLGEKDPGHATPWNATAGPRGMNRSLTPFAEALPAMRAHPAHDEIVAVVARHGFADLAEFADVADRIVLAYVALKTADRAPQQIAQLESSIKQIEASEMAPAQKQRMLDAMRESLRMTAAYQAAPEPDRAALRPHLGELDAAFR